MHKKICSGNKVNTKKQKKYYIRTLHYKKSPDKIIDNINVAF